MLKGRLVSLQELRLALQTKSDMQHIIQWINTCVTLHNMIVRLGDAWEEMARDSRLDGPQHLTEHLTPSAAEDIPSQVQACCIEINCANDTLPIV
jgi:hypothetical protein